MSVVLWVQRFVLVLRSRVGTPEYAFWNIDYFKLVIFKKRKAPEKPLAFPLPAYKNLDGGPAPGRELSSQISIA